MGRKGKWGIVLETGEEYSLVYADDVVLVADDEGGMKLMMRVVEECVRLKELTINVRLQ